MENTDAVASDKGELQARHWFILIGAVIALIGWKAAGDFGMPMVVAGVSLLHAGLIGMAVRPS